MLRKSNPTFNPARFNTKSFKSLLEAVAATEQPDEKKKETKRLPEEPLPPKPIDVSPVGRLGGGFKRSESESKEGYGGRRPDPDTKQASGLSPSTWYASGIPLSFMQTGLGMQGADYGLSILPLKVAQNVGAATVGLALPAALQALSPEASRAYADAIPNLDTGDIPDEYRSMVAAALGIEVPDLPPSSNKSMTAKTITFGGKEMSVTPDSLIGKLSDPYGIRPFVDFAKKMGDTQKEKLKKEKENPFSLLRQLTVDPVGY